MARRSQLFTLMPWSGGINDSADPGAIPSTDLVTADNILYTTAGARIKRPGFEYIDNIELPAVTSISRSGTTVTVVFASAINDGTNNMLVAGEKITLVSSNSAFNVTDTEIASIASSTSITYATVASGTIGAGATVTSLVRSSSTVGIHDFWYFNPSNNTKEQTKVMLTSQGKLFKFDGSGNRLEITKATANVTGTLATPAVFTLSSHGFNTGTAIAFSSITGGTGLSINTVYYVEYIDANTFYLSATLGGSRIALSAALTASTMSVPFALSLPITTCDFKSFNEKLFIAVDGINNFPIIYDPTVGSTYTYIKNAMPNASILSEHEGRLLANDKFNPDRLHYSAPGDHTKWQGYDDSGVIDIGVGDGDPSGITAIFPTFKGTLFISKSETLYRMPDPGMALSRVELVSGGVGAVSHRGCAPIDMDDVYFISKRGFHSLAATNAYGDFSGAYLSEKIQNAFQDFSASRRKYTWGRYFSKFNTVLFTVADTSASAQDSIYAYNIKFKEWVRWPSVNMQCVTTAKSGSTDIMMFGTSDSRLVGLSTSSYSDETSTSGAYNYRVKTGKIYVDGNPSTVKGFKRLSVIFKPQGTFQFDVNVKIDNLPTQSLSFSKSTSGDLLGSTFILGQSTLSYSSAMDPFSLPIDGYGRGIQIEIVNSGADEQVVIYGMTIEYVPAGLAQETFISGTTTE
jgi:hypothetical protein